MLSGLDLTDKFTRIRIISLLSVLILTIFSVGFFHPDEQYYAVDFAAYKTGLLPYLRTWEFETELRPWALPLLFTPIMLIGKWLDLSPFTHVFILRLISGLFAFISYVFFSNGLSKRFKSEVGYRYFLLFLHFTFFINFFAVRTNSENWATSFFLFGLSFLLKQDSKNILKASILLGLSFLMRHQMGFLVLGVGLHLLIIEKLDLKKWVLNFVAPIILIFLIELGIDSWGYGHLSFSPYHYIYQNLILGKVNNFGTHPITFYFTRSIQKTGPFGIFFFSTFFYYLFKKRRDQLLWAVAPFILVHHLVGHKELRFLFPVAPLLLAMGFLWIDEKNWLMKASVQKFVKISFILNGLVLVFISFKPAYSPLGFYKALYQNNVKELKFYVEVERREPELELSFFKKKDLVVSKLENDLGSAKGFIWTTSYKDLSLLFKRKECEVLFSTYPQWVMEFNIGGWRERSNIWGLSRCHL